MKKIKVDTEKIYDKTYGEEIVAINLQYGLDNIQEARNLLQQGEFTRGEILRAIGWYRTLGHDNRQSILESAIEEATEDYKNII